MIPEIIGPPLPRRFIHIPKTGGTSVMDYMLRHGIDCLWGAELTKNWYPKKKHGPAILWRKERSEKFAIVRHPATRLVSSYRYCQTFGAYQNCTFREFLQDRLMPDVERPLIEPWRDQCWWITWNDRVIVDRLLRLETLEQDVHDYLGDFGPVGRINTTGAAAEDLLSWYSEKDLRRVKKAFARDYEVLGYD